jgi:hypothetical protein
VPALRAPARKARDGNAWSGCARFLAPLCLALLALYASASTRPQATPVSVAQSHNGPTTPASFQAELRRIQLALEANPQDPGKISAIERSIPEHWDVQTPDVTYEVPSDPLRAWLDGAVRDPSQRTADLQKAADWTRELAAAAAGYAASDEQHPDARAKLQRILAAREFDTEYKPSAWERLQQRFWVWVGRVLARLAARMSRYPIAARGLFWLFLIGAVGCVAMLVFRAWQRRARMEELNIPAAPKVTQTWQEWMRAAKLAADAGSFRDAVHSLYWAGTVCLEDSGVIPRERWRTPRERMRRLATDRVREAAKQRDALQALTVRLERIWYAGTPATRQDFLESLGLAEELGCRPS